MSSTVLDICPGCAHLQRPGRPSHHENCPRRPGANGAKALAPRGGDWRAQQQAVVAAYFKDFDASKHPRGGDTHYPGRFSEGWGGRHNSHRAVKAKYVAKLSRYRDPAIRRRIAHALANEARLAQAIGGFNVPDSWPADVMIVIGADGKLLSADPNFKSKEFLNRREQAIDIQKNGLKWPDERGRRLSWLEEITEGEAIRQVRKREADALREALRATVVFVEVKTLWTSAKDEIHMSRKATKRKTNWEKRYNATFHTVTFDDRKGKKHSGNRLYYKPGVGSAKLSAMTAAPTFDDLALNMLGSAMLRG
ncbi:MAG TPA: hypothetical protein VH643_21155 [Gemmataceae bacterium]|jgi:hypothetical protein